MSDYRKEIIDKIIEETQILADKIYKVMDDHTMNACHNALMVVLANNCAQSEDPEMLQKTWEGLKVITKSIREKK